MVFGTRHSGGSRNPFCLGLRHCRDNRLTSVCVSSTIHGRRSLSFACPKESNPRKGHPRGRGLPGIPARQTSQELGGLRREHIHVLSSKWPASCRPPLRGFSSESLPRPRGAREEQSAAVPAAEAPDICDTSVLALRSSPLSSGGGWTEKPRAPHAGGARDRADSDNRPWMACGPNPSARSEPSAQLRARIRGRVLFGYFLLHEQEKVTGRHGWRPNHTRT